MPTYTLRIDPEDIIRLVRAEIESSAGQPELYESAWEDYIIAEDFDHRAYGLDDGEQYSLVTDKAILNVEPRLEQNYWVLSVVVQKNLGPQIIDDENALLGAEMSMEEFESRFLAPGEGEVSVHLEAQTPQGKKHFDDWWAGLKKRHADALRRAP